MLISPVRSKTQNAPLEEVSRLLHLIDKVHGGSATPTTAESSQQLQCATPAPDDPSDGLRLPGLSTLFPAFSSGRSNSESADPTPTSSGTIPTLASDSPALASPRYAPPAKHALSNHLEAVRRGFSFHRKCNRHAFVAYDERQVDRLLAEFQSSVSDNRPLTDATKCEVFSVAVIAATFNRLEIASEVGDLFYRTASELISTWVLSQPLTAMRCCALLGLSNLFQKATISLLYFDLALALANGWWRTLGLDTLDVSRRDHVEVQQIWRSLVFGRAWLQSTIGACTSDDQLWLPPITVKVDDGSDVDTFTKIKVLIPIEIARIAVIAARAMRILTACTSPSTLLAAVHSLFQEIGDWYDGLPSIASANELSQKPWDESRVCLAYVHLGHLGAITLIFRRTLSIYKQKPSGQKLLLQPAERSQLAMIFSDGIVAAEQSSRILYIFLGEQAGIRHCWAVIYIAFVSAAILLYCTSQMQLHDFPEREWQPYLDLVENDMEILAYCQELDPVACRLRDTLSQYMQFLRMPAQTPKRRRAPPSWPRATSHPEPGRHQHTPNGQSQGQDLADMLLTIPAGRAGPAQTSMDLRALLCQPFDDDQAASSSSTSASSGFKVPPRPGMPHHKTLPDRWDNNQAFVARMPFGWQQCQSSAAFTGRSTNLALTAAQAEMHRASV